MTNSRRRIGLCRGAAVALASAVAISLTALSAGIVPAFADDAPGDSTETPSETGYPPDTGYPTDTGYPPSTPTDEPVQTPVPATAELTPSDSASSTTTPSSSSSSATPTTETTQTSTGSSTTPSAVASTTSVSPAPSAEVPASGAKLAEQALIVQPEVLEASEEDVRLAESLPSVQSTPETLQPSEIDDIKNRLGIATDLSSGVASTSGAPQVVQLPQQWVDQDDNRKPVISNPLDDWLQLFYVDRGHTLTLKIPPGKSTAIDVAPGVYDITAIVLDAFGKLLKASVGSIISGPPPHSDTDVPVLVDKSGEKFRVGKLTDLGDDPDVGGERKVLLDGGTPAWGRWTQTTTGERQFEIHKTQQFPGIDAPAEGPLPGYRLVADDEPFSSSDVLLIVLAAIIAAVAIGATISRVIRRRRDPQREQHKQHDRNERPDTRVEATSRPGSPSAVVRETPAPGEATHAVRLATHSHPGTLTVKEVNDDHSRTE